MLVTARRTIMDGVEASAQPTKRLPKFHRAIAHTFITSPCVLAIALLSGTGISQAHDWHAHRLHNEDAAHVVKPEEAEPEEAEQEEAKPDEAGQQIPLAGPQAKAFAPFSKTVDAHIDGQHLVVESNGLPDHQMMVGIVSWQQQVPLPQPFTGQNAWRLPLHPQPAAKPISVLKEPLGGAIALAVNGVPIFCALNNRGEDTLLAGELDEWGGHCGRGDDYHYHAAPVHLEKHVGVGNPIGYALDGYPILGFTEADGSIPKDLDEFNGHKDADGNYHYHATKSFPYINGGLVGKVTMDGNQVKQPRDSPTRPSLQPLRGATITGFNQNGDQYDLEYEIAGKKGHVKYSTLDDEQVEFTYIEPSGKTSTALYQRGKRGQGGSTRVYLVVGLLLVGVIGAIAFARRATAKD